MKKAMRFSTMRFCLLAASFLILLAGCGGGTDNTPTPATPNEYYMKARFNGELKDFLHTAIFQGGGNDGRWEHIVFSGHESSVPATPNLEEVPPQIGIEIWNMGGNVAPATYTEAANGPDSDLPGDYSLSGEYLIQTADQGTIQFDAGDTEDFTLVITEISKENGIKGTFHGTLTNQDNSAEVITVTDGSFYLPYNVVVGK